MRRQVRIFAGFAGTLILIAAAASCGDSTTAPANKRYIANLNAAAEGGTVTSAGSGVVTFEEIRAT